MTVYIHALREEGDRTSRYLYSRFGTFLSTPSARRATDLPLFCDGDRHDFYPRPPRGGRRRALLPLSSAVNFYPRPPRGGRRRALLPLSSAVNFYPRPPRGGRHPQPPDRRCQNQISIHALREEGDMPRSTPTSAGAYFYPRPPRGGRPIADYFGIPTGVISIHALREEGDVLMLVSVYVIFTISIHALREEGDSAVQILDTVLNISIHALREEGDFSEHPPFSTITHFYPRPPRGGRPFHRSGHRRSAKFLPTPSARRATLCLLFLFVLFVFLPTPSARRATSALWAMTSSHRYFYPRPPRGGRPGTAGRWPHRQRISTHALREEGDQFGPGSFNYTINISTHALREEGDQTVGGLIYDQHNFYPRPPRGGRPGKGHRFRAIMKFLPTPSARRATQLS